MEIVGTIWRFLQCTVITMKLIFMYFVYFQGKCQRKDPPCKYLHPPQHLREQLLQNGKNNLILKNLQMQAMAAGLVPVGAPGMMPVVSVCFKIMI